MRGHFFRSRQNVHKMYVHVHMYVNLLLGTQCNVINIININVLLQLMRIMQMITSWLYDTRLLGINSYAQIPTGITAELWYISSQPVVHSDQCFFVCLIVCLFAWLCVCLLVCVFVCLFGIFRPTPEFFTTLETSPLPVKGCKFWPMLGTYSHWAVRVL